MNDYTEGDRLRDLGIKKANENEDEIWKAKYQALAITYLMEEIEIGQTFMFDQIHKSIKLTLDKPHHSNVWSSQSFSAQCLWKKEGLIEKIYFQKSNIPANHSAEAWAWKRIK